jgi:hypothetical protein
MSLSFGSCSFIMGAGWSLGWGMGLRGLCRAAASRAAMLDGEGTRSAWSPCTLSEVVLAVLEMIGLLTPPGPSVWSRCKAAGLPVPTLVAASNAALSPPVYVLLTGFGFGFGVGLEKAFEAPCNAALRTLYCTSPAGCGTQP